jgi:hypothetical protein
MAAPTSETFSYAYAITVSGTSVNSTIQLNTDPKHNAVEAATGIVVKDPDGGQITQGNVITVFSETKDEGLGTGTNYTFIGEAHVKDQSGTLDGIVIEEGGNYYFLTDTQYSGNVSGGNGGGNIVATTDIICFMAGTLVRTPNGEVAVESLKRGDLVLTQDGRSVPVDWLGIQTVSLRFADKMRVLPIRIRAGALAENVPSRDLLLSPDHAILVQGALIQAGALVNGTSIARETDVPTTFTYYHVEVDDHSLILAENTPAETFVDNIDRLHFDNWAEHQALYPNGKHVNELPYPRAKSHRQVPVSIRVMLGARAQAIGAMESSAVA